MTRRFGLALGTLALALICTPSVRAQGRGMGMMGGMGGMAGLGLLSTPEGKAELKITDEQATKLRELQENMRATMMEKFQELQGTPPEEMREKAAPIMKEIGDSTKKELESILDKDQFKRYKQISIQAMGFQAFFDEEVVKALKITEEQTQKLEAMQEEMQGAMQDAFQSAQDDRQAAMQKIGEIRTKAFKDAAELLSAEQKTAWGELIGKEFKMPAGGPGGGRRRQID
jgi:Spy/CpxP family protein refolding chaperone